MIDINELRRLAQAATSGEWYVKRGNHIHARIRATDGEEEWHPSIACTDDDEVNVNFEANAAFIAAANPAAISELLDRLEAAEKECDAATKCADMLALALNTSNHERDALRAKIKQMEQQEPIGEMLEASAHNYELRWYRPVPVGAKLYALPGAQPAPSVPEDVMRDAERYRYLRGRDDSTAGVGCWLEAGGKACARGWLNGDQLDRAIDCCAIEALAAAPEAKP